MNNNQQKKQQIEQMRKYALHHYFTSNARQRLGNIKLISIQKYNKIIDMSIAMAQNNDLKSPIRRK
jgi:DNA-binding TFAR19-related protein (PDSD5 family)